MKKVKYLMTKIITGLLNMIYRYNMYLPTKNAYTKKTTNEHKICRIIKTNKELKGAQCSVPAPQMLVETMWTEERYFYISCISEIWNSAIHKMEVTTYHKYKLK